jgi:hypothetical protein
MFASPPRVHCSACAYDRGFGGTVFVPSMCSQSGLSTL